jgi:ATP synthase protein I
LRKISQAGILSGWQMTGQLGPKLPPKDPLRRDNPDLRAGAQFMGLGLQFAGAIVLFLFVGQWIDRKLGTDPWGLYIGVFTGFGAGFLSMYRALTVAEQRDRAKREQEQSEQ